MSNQTGPLLDFLFRFRSSGDFRQRISYSVFVGAVFKCSGAKRELESFDAISVFLLFYSSIVSKSRKRYRFYFFFVNAIGSTSSGRCFFVTHPPSSIYEQRRLNYSVRKTIELKQVIRRIWRPYSPTPSLPFPHYQWRCSSSLIPGRLIYCID